ncbi:MAG: hypothetical protein N2517_01810 [Ignavibacteria bacterium]|nr:hypothetical protein [Ignavibacteria bacterium]
MLNTNDIVLSLKVKLLQEKIEEAKQILIQLIEEWYHLRYVVKPMLEFEYEMIFGELEKEYEQKVELCITLEHKLDLFLAKINRGIQITKEIADIIEKVVSKAAFTRTREYAKPTNGNPYFIQGLEDNTASKQKEISQMYRALVKKLHPDVVGESEFNNKFWISLQDAYKEKNYQKIKVFYKILMENSLPPIVEEYILDKLERELKELKLLIGIERRAINRMLNQEPFIYEKLLSDKTWIETHKIKLKEKIKFLEKQIDINRKLLERINEGVANQ